MNRTLVFVLVLAAIAVAGFLIFQSQQPAKVQTTTQQNNQQSGTPNTTGNTNTSTSNTSTTPTTPETTTPPTTTQPETTTPPTSSTEEPVTTAEQPQTPPTTTTTEETATTEQPTSTPDTTTTTVGGVKNPNVFVQASIGDADTLDPVHAYDTASSEILMNLYDNLIAFDGPSTEKFVPMLATAVPSTENGLLKVNDDGSMIMTFPIRTGVKFHDGTDMTSADVVYSFRRIMVHSHPDSPAWIFLEDLLGVQDFGDLATEVGDEKACEMLKEAVYEDAENVIFKFPLPSATFLSRIAHGGSWGAITSKSYTIEHGGWNEDCAVWRNYYQKDKVDLALHQAADGTGPFKLERWTPDEVIVLIKNENYWRAPALLERVEFRVVPEFGTRKLMIEQGDADQIEVPQQYINQMAGVKGVRSIHHLPLIANTTAFFNYDIPVDGNPNVGSAKLDGEGIPADFFTDIDVRKGFAYSFNWAEFIEQIYLNEATQPNGPIPSSLPYVNKENAKYTLDLAKAEEHFKKAWGGKVWETGFKFTIIYNEGNDQRKVAAEIFKENIESINEKFVIEVRSAPWPTFLDDMRGRRIPLWISGWQSDFPDPHNFVQPYMHSQGAHAVRQTLSKIADFDDLVIAASRETDTAKREQMYFDLQQKAYELAINVFLVDPFEREWQRTWVNGWTYNAIWPGNVRYLYGVSKVENGQVSPEIIALPGAIVDSW